LLVQQQETSGLLVKVREPAEAHTVVQGTVVSSQGQPQVVRQVNGPFVAAVPGEEEKVGDSSKGTETVLGEPSRKSRATRVGGEEASEKGKEASSKTTWREMILRLD
jgi:hypothetical protein